MSALAARFSESSRASRARRSLPAVLFLACATARASEAAELPLLSQTLVEVRDNYFDTRRIVPGAMLAGALEEVEKTVPEVMVEGEVASGTIRVTVGAATQDFDVSRMDSVERLQAAMVAVMRFVVERLVTPMKPSEIERAAVNGMLATLDGHSLVLEPRVYRGMRLNTRGEHAGVGLVIAVRNGDVAVVKVYGNTPARRADIRPGDVVTEIGERSTAGMDLEEVVDLLRGRPGSTVAMSIVRPGVAVPLRLHLVRDRVLVPAIASARLLDAGVGYVKVSGFSATTARSLRAAIDAERIQAGGRLRGLILDLRGNRGGILEQAMDVSDLFLSEGTIVKMVARSERQEARARRDRGDLGDLAMVVLVDGASAAASEIVASALRDNERALVIGRQTFGDGLVQVLFEHGDPRSEEGGAVKISVGQLFTPRGAAIQQAGIVPDVLLLPGRILPGAVSWFAPPRVAGEADLERRREKRAEESRPRAEKAALELHYLLADEAGGTGAVEAKGRDAARRTAERLEQEAANAIPDEFTEDYPIRFARDLLARAPVPDRRKQLEAAKALVAEQQADEERRLEASLAQLGVNWSAGPTEDGQRAVVTVSPPPGSGARAGETVSWTVTVENRGNRPFHRLRAWTAGGAGSVLDRREFLFGLVKPGEKRSWTVRLELPRSLDTRRHDATLHFEADSGSVPPDVATSLDVVQQPRPLFAFSAQVDDEANGNGDGVVEPGEAVSLRVDVRNAGAGPSGEKTYLSVKNLAGEKVLIRKGRVVIGALKPGEVKTALLPIDVRKGLDLDGIPLRLQIVDETAEELLSERIELPVRADGPMRAPAQGGVQVAGDTLLRSGAADAAAPVALARRGAVLPALARVGGHYKVEWEKGRFGFVPIEAVQVRRTARRTGAVAEVWQRQAPHIALVPDPAKGAAVVDGEKWRVEGTAAAPPPPGGGGTPLRDVLILVNGRKIFLKVVPERSATGPIDFAAEVALRPGDNTVTVIAREDEELQAHRTVHVYRRTPVGAGR